MITIVDYGVGNINAFVNVYKRGDIPIRVAQNKEELKEASKIILPGVGHFDYAMHQLNRSGMRETLDDMVLSQKVPVIGICVGMQMMANYSDEGVEKGLGWIDARVRRFDESTLHSITKLPHMGWNDVMPRVPCSPLFLGLEERAVFYFLHSYYFECHHEGDVIATTEYGIRFACAVNNQNIFGIQFHPEKSHHYGEKLLHNFANL